MLADLESLRCFEAAAAASSFRAAAERVHLSPAAFGERIKRLEETLAQSLFTRTTRRVALTPAGRRLLPWARQLLAEAAGLRERLAAVTGPSPFALTIGTRYELGLSWLVPSLGVLAETRPERTIHLAFGDTHDLLRRLRQGSIDAFVSSARLATPGLKHAALHPERYVLVAAPALLARHRFDRPEHASALVLLDAEADLPLFRYFLDGAAPEQVYSFKKIELLGTIAAIRARALEGVGVAVLPHYFVAKDLLEKRLKVVLPKIKPSQDQFRLVYPGDHPSELELIQLAKELLARPLR